MLTPFARALGAFTHVRLCPLPLRQIGAILHDPRIREQEFGNFQSPGLSAAVRAQVRAGFVAAWTRTNSPVGLGGGCARAAAAAAQ